MSLSRNIKSKVKCSALLIIIAFLCIVTFLEQKHSLYGAQICEIDSKSHKSLVQKYFKKRDDWHTSNLGSILFKNMRLIRFMKSKRKTFLVLVWKYWYWLKKRFVDFYQKNDTESSNVLEGCSVSNCKFSSDDSDIEIADAIVVHMTSGVYPTVKQRNPKQRWIFLSDESPMNSYFTSQSPPKTSSLAGIFNWTMTYRTDSDIPVPYGRTIPLAKPLFTELCSEDMEAALSKMVPFWREKQFKVLAMVMMSNCQSNRLAFVNTLRNLIAVDIHGNCSDSNKQTCPGYINEDCKNTRQYLFYLVLENSRCRQYLSEKIFQHAYSKGAIPVIVGPPLEDCEKLLPPNSFLHVDNFKSIWELAVHMQHISNSFEAIMSYHAWRKHFAVTNEHGYFGSRSVHLCRVCEALNYNAEDKSVYDKDKLNKFLSRRKLCDTNYTKGRW